MSGFRLSRRNLIIGSGLVLAGCDKIAYSPKARPVLSWGEHASYGWQRLIQGDGSMAREFRPDQISPHFKSNGTMRPGTPMYLDHLATKFENWRLEVTGLVKQPLRLSLADLRAMQGRTQITRHDCVEGWSAIGQWTGPQLSRILNASGIQNEARYVVFHCMDNLGGEADKGGLQSPGMYYESIDLADAYHPQTIIAIAMNGQPLDVLYGAPARLRVERQLGYKQAKYLGRIELVSSLQGLHGGHGGFWEDRGYEWYAGI